MLNPWDPDEYETVFDSRTCSFHQEHPGFPYAGCTCSCSSYQKRRPAEDIAKIKAQKIKVREDAILAEAEQIKARRARESE